VLLAMNGSETVDDDVGNGNDGDDVDVVGD
jgi:hypothetical protein